MIHTSYLSPDLYISNDKIIEENVTLRKDKSNPYHSHFK